MFVFILWMFLIPNSISYSEMEKLTCHYPAPSSIQPCSCQMEAENEREEVYDDEKYSYIERRTFSGTFFKTMTCNLEDKFSFYKAAQAFDYDNRIPVLKITGEHDGDFFLTKKDLGRLNVSYLTIETVHSNTQKIFEEGAFKGSEDSIYFLAVKIKNTYKVQDNVRHVRLDYIKQICSSLGSLEVHGVSDIKSEDFEGCSKLSYLRLLNSNIAWIGPDFFRYLPHIRNFEFSSHSKIWIKTGAFQDLMKLESVHFYAASNPGEEYSITSLSNLTVISSGAFKSLPNLSVLGFACTGPGCRQPPIRIDLFEEMPFLGLDHLHNFVVLNGQQASLPRLFDHASELDKFLFKPGLKTVKENAFEGLSNVTDIVLSHNKLSSLNNSFKKLPQLTKIDLSHNKLTSLNNAFKELPHLTKIDLSHNNIISLSNSFEELPALKDIDLSGNTKLTSLNTEIQNIIIKGRKKAIDDGVPFVLLDEYNYHYHNIFQLNMNDIPLDCGCDLKWLARDPEMLYHFVPGAKCVDGVLLKTAARKTLQDVMDKMMTEDYNTDYHSEVANKTIVELSCPSNYGE